MSSFPAPLLEEVGQQERHLVVGERVLGRPGQLVPGLRAASGGGGIGMNLFQPFGAGARRACRPPVSTLRSQSARDLPAAEVAGRGVAPDVGREPPRARPIARDLDDRAGVDARSPGRTPACTRRRGRAASASTDLERRGQVGPVLGEVRLPVHPAAHELAVVVPLVRADGPSPGAAPPRCRARAAASSRPSRRCSTGACRRR